MRAFTLVEVVIAVGIFALISIALADLIIGNDSLLRSQSATVDVIGSASSMMTDIQTMTLQAKQIAASHSFSGTIYNSASSTLVLQLPSITSAGSIIGGQYDYVAYYATGTSAYRLVDPGTGSIRTAGTRLLSDTITTLSFSYGSANQTLSTSTVIDIQTQKTWKRINATTHVHNQVYLRNN